MHSSRMRTDRTLTVFPYWGRMEDPPVKNGRPPLGKIGDPPLTRHPLP